MPLNAAFARLCRQTRTGLRLTQQRLADMVGVSRGHIANVERGRANPSLGLVDRIANALGLELELVARAPAVIGGRHQRDLVHARCSAYADRRLRSLGWLTAREVEIVHARSHGWIDLIAFHPMTGTLVVVEVKTRLDDLGAIERQLAWYERSIWDVADRLGWRPKWTASWLLVLASHEVEDVLHTNRELFARAFPVRARAMASLLEGVDQPIAGRGVALIDPSSKRRAWLVPSRTDGRRSSAPYIDYADAARRLSGSRS